MANLETPETPSWPDVYQLEVDDPVAGGPDGVDNRPHKQLAERTEYLKGRVDDAQEALAGHEKRLATVEGSSAVTVSRAQELAWAESDEGFAFELFGDLVHTWIDSKPVSVTRTVKGDDSVDVQSTSGLTVGASYVLSGGEHSETVVVREILNGTRFKAQAELLHTRDTGTLARTDWAMHSGYALAPDSGTYYSRPLDVLRFWSDGVMIIRRDAGDGVLTIAARQIGEAAWQPAEFMESKQATPGTRDERYRIPVGGVVELRIQTAHGPSKSDMRITHMMLLTSPQAGRADEVRRPVNVTPAGGASDIMETPTLVANEYRSLYGLTQAGAEFRVATDEGFGDVVYTGEETTAKTSHQVAADNLATDAVYWWQCRYKDAEGTWSSWSEPTAFSTGSVFQYVDQPEAVAPANGATDVSLRPILQSSAFKPVGGEDTHEATQWQIATDAGFSTIVYDSGECGDLASHAVGNSLALDVPHYWHCRQKGAAFGWSAWSAPSEFTPHEVILEQGEYCGGTVDADGKGIVWDRPGTYDFVVPEGVEEVCVVCVGGGGSGANAEGQPSWHWHASGGGGGALGYKNYLLLHSGEKYSVTVGRGGTETSKGDGESGGTTSFSNIMSVLGGQGGKAASSRREGGDGGTAIGALDGSGVGGKGGSTESSQERSRAGYGGGAGGYNGSGSGGGRGTAREIAGGGGGIGLYGNGVQSIGDSHPGGGRPGPGGGWGGPYHGFSVESAKFERGRTARGGKYGGGGGGHDGRTSSYACGQGGSGAVRIMWGVGRSFPDNAALTTEAK